MQQTLQKREPKRKSGTERRIQRIKNIWNNKSWNESGKQKLKKEREMIGK